MRTLRSPRYSFVLPLFTSMPPRQPSVSSRDISRRPKSVIPGTIPREVPDPLLRLVQARLRLHLLHLARQARRNSMPPEALKDLTGSDKPDDLFSSPTNIRSNQQRKTGRTPSTSGDASYSSESYSLEERRTRSERLRALWRKPSWRESMLAKQRSEETLRRKSETLKKLWQDEAWRQKMRDARTGRSAPNKGVSASAVTRLRMSLARKGIPFSEETKRRMSVAKRIRPEGDDWPKLISESKKGKTREYFAMKREFRALHRDLKLWSDSYRSKFGRLPNATTFDRFVAPMMVFRIYRYLTLRETIGDDADSKTDIFSK